MRQYSIFVGKRVDVRYKAGALHLSAAGILLIDNGDTISLEDHFLQNGKQKTMRVEVPYGCILNIAEAKEEVAVPSGGVASKPK
jgi:hypothetical protein